MKKLLTTLLLLLPILNFAADIKLTEEEEKLIPAMNTNEKRYQVFYKIIHEITGMSQKEYLQNIKNMALSASNYCGSNMSEMHQLLVEAKEIDKDETDLLLIYYASFVIYGIAYERNEPNYNYRESESVIKCVLGTNPGESALKWREKNKGHLRDTLYKIEEKMRKGIY